MLESLEEAAVHQLRFSVTNDGEITAAAGIPASQGFHGIVGAACGQPLLDVDVPVADEFGQGGALVVGAYAYGIQLSSPAHR